ncbi:E3 ubiquitin-protein ligase SH3RF2 [Megalops cyprinoides]|uniref:E3 ubiquitin-protein ligase SH3RF2 n=1 Tax=Megalops cyprinoides TaxID=118141 RepID=UPI00186536AF|nr:E3 ubiquitin-protein ligase SH3RF2 [Megalops cyprinoides]
MDDLALLDLLECPLCFERLDVTAKVLPCQHTFCKPCLRRLAASRTELRCPECRAPAPTGVEELPANLLLVRLLEGLRQGPGGPARAGSGRHAVPAAQDEARRTREARYSHPTQRRQTQARRNPLDGVPWARALYNYKGNVPGELNMKSGDIIILRRKVDENWYHGEANGSSGLVPASMVQVVNQLPQPLPLCRALYDFDIKGKDEEDSKDCLSFLKGDIITVIRRVDENWVEGKLGEKVGIFPLQFTEPNSAAAKLLEKRKGGGTAESRLRTGTGSLAEPSGGRRLSPGTPRSPLVPTAPSTQNRLAHPVQGPPDDRQPPDISPPTFLGSSNPALVAQVGEIHTEVNSSIPPQVSAAAPGERKASGELSPTIAMALINPQPLSASAESKQTSAQQLSISVCAVLYSYTPRRAEELELRKGEMVGVYGKFKEGWLRGLSLRTGKVGILPGNYVTPVLRTSARFLDPKSSLLSQNAVAGKRPATGKPQAAILPLDRVTTSGATRPAGQAPLVAMATPPVMSSPGTLRAAQQEGVQGRSSTRRPFHSAHRGPSLQGGLHSRVPAAAVVRPQQPQPSGGPLQMQGLACGPATQRIKHGLPENPIRPMCWVSEAAAPSAGDSLILEQRDVSPKEVPERQASVGPQSILVKPDAHKNNSDKPIKSVRFLTQEGSVAGTRTVSLPPGGQGSSNSQSVGPVLEAWASQGPMVHLATGSMLMDGSATALKKSTAYDSAAVDGILPSLKPASSSASQPNACRHRVVMPYTAQSDAELHLREGELVLVQRPRQDGRVLVTQEKSGKTGLFQSGVMEALEKLS